MTREQKLKKDAKTIAKYEQKLRKTAKVYSQTAEADAINQRKSRAAAIGACALEVMDSIRGLAKTKPLMEGTLEYMIREWKVKDPDGKIGFHCAVTYKVCSSEHAFTEEQIREEIEKTAKQLQAETDELFPEEKKDEQ